MWCRIDGGAGILPRLRSKWAMLPYHTISPAQWDINHAGDTGEEGEGHSFGFLVFFYVRASMFLPGLCPLQTWWSGNGFAFPVSKSTAFYLPPFSTS